MSDADFNLMVDATGPFLSHHLEWDLRANHLVRDAAGLAWAGRYLSGRSPDRWLNLAIAWELVLLVLVVYVPLLQRAFGTFSFRAEDWILTVLLAASIVPVLELIKWLARRNAARSPDQGFL